MKSSGVGGAADVTGVDVVLEERGGRASDDGGGGGISEDFDVVIRLVPKENLGISLTGRIKFVSSWTRGAS